jgi:Tfp pilus assembly protein FimT
MQPTHRSRSAGFSAVDMLCVVSIIGIVSAMAVFQVEAARPGLRGDGAARNVIAQLTTARELAISERRNIEVTFPGPNLVSLVRHEVPAGTTTLRTVALEGGVEFRLTAGVSDTPDAFGNAAPIDLVPLPPSCSARKAV